MPSAESQCASCPLAVNRLTSSQPGSSAELVPSAPIEMEEVQTEEAVAREASEEDEESSDEIVFAGQANSKHVASTQMQITASTKPKKKRGVMKSQHTEAQIRTMTIIDDAEAQVKASPEYKRQQTIEQEEKMAALKRAPSFLHKEDDSDIPKWVIVVNLIADILGK